MNAVRQPNPKNPDVNVIWRFYSDSNGQWRWQRLSFDGTVVEQSDLAYAKYQGCLDNACERGYVFLPSLSTRPESKSPRTKRSYMRLPT